MVDYNISLSEMFNIALKEYKSISINPKVMSGMPCIAGRRIPVHCILSAIILHGDIDAVMKCYKLTKRQVKDALRFARTVLECSVEDDGCS